MNIEMLLQVQIFPMNTNIFYTCVKAVLQLQTLCLFFNIILQAQNICDPVLIPKYFLWKIIFRIISEVRDPCISHTGFK